MRTTTLVLALAALASISIFGGSPAQAQATRTWVSGVGDDANPCSRTAPCKTFAGAISKTAAGGEISALDPGGFGTVTITKAITLNGDGTLAGILAAGTNGIVVNAGPNDKVVIRNLSINGVGTGINGIRFLKAKELTIDQCSIDGFTGNAVDVNLSATGSVLIKNSYISNANKGVSLATTAGFAVATISGVHIFATTASGVESTTNGGFADIINSVINGVGGSGVFVSAGTGQISVDSSMLDNNGTAINAASSGSMIRISNNTIYGNQTAYNIGAGATVASDMSNRTGANGGTQTPNGSITKQ